MKTRNKIFLVLCTLLCVSGGVAGSIKNDNVTRYATHYRVAKAEGDETIDEEPTGEEVVEEEPVVEEVFESTIVINETTHGTVLVDKEKGHVDEAVIIEVKADTFYLVEKVVVNGVELEKIEGETNKYTFNLVEGENVIEVVFAVDNSLVENLSLIYEKVLHGDWTNFFTTENTFKIVFLAVLVGLLTTFIVYFYQYKKKLAKLVAQTKKEVLDVAPTVTQNVIVNTTKEVLEPTFAKISAYQEEIIRLIAALTKCTALIQENTPEAKRAVLDELSKLNVSDTKVIDEVKENIDQYFKTKLDDYNNVVANLNKVIEKNKAIIEENNKKLESKVENKVVEEKIEKKVESKEDGTQF